MESNNNGKITVGILTMFVVAISIIGVTYAYFTAQFSTNLNPESVKVYAGELVANYKTSNSISITNVVPGWVSDGLHYYDVDVAAANDGEIYAVKATYAYTQQENTKATERMGLAEPIAFSVSNSSSSADAVNYIIALQIKKNGIYDAWTSISEESLENNEGAKARKSSLYADRGRLYATLYSGTFNIEKDVSENYGEGNEILAGPFLLADTGVQQVIVKAPETIEKGGAEKKYFIVFKFANDTENTQITQGIQLNIEAKVIGIQKDNNASVTYTSLINSNTITATNMIVKDEGTSEDANTLEGNNKNTKLNNYKSEHGEKTVWYDSNNNIVYFALDSEETNDGLDSDDYQVYE